MKRDLISEFLEVGEVFVVGVGRDHIAINVVDRNGMSDGFKVIVAVQIKSKIILIALLHELAQLLLALLGKNFTTNHCGQNNNKIA